MSSNFIIVYYTPPGLKAYSEVIYQFKPSGSYGVTFYDRPGGSNMFLYPLEKVDMR